MKVIVPRAPMLREPDVKNVEISAQLSFGSQVWHRPFADEEREDALRQSGWSMIRIPTGHIPEARFLKSLQLAPPDFAFKDPVAVAELFVHTPYVWGGDSGFGIDCSGLVQAALTACGVECPRDSDMQEAELGQELPEDAPLRRGDLLFWKGHVAWVADPDTILHANAFHMAVTFEPMQDAINRIEAQGDGPVTARKRLGGQ